MKLLKQEVRLIENVVFIFVGLMLTLVVPQFTYGGVCLIFFFAGSGLTLISLFDTLLAVQGKPFPTLKRIRKNEAGVVWIWVAAASTLIMAAIVYFVIRYPMDLIIEVVTDNYTFKGVMGASFTLCLQIVGWLLGFCVFGVLLWVLVNANRRGPPFG